MKIRSRLMSCVAIGAVAALGNPAYADAPSSAPSAASQDYGSADIVVTARRKEEALQNVPISITALSQTALTERSVTSATDLPKLSTGLVVAVSSGNPAIPEFSIRGRGQVYGAATGSVETYFAEIPLNSTFQVPSPPPQFFDLNSVQVLKGPQGTLFGRNTTGGAVVIVPQAPKLGVTEGYVRIQGGTYGDFQAEGAINLPLGDKAALRVAAFDWQRRGYVNSSETDSLTGTTQTDITTGRPIGSQNFNNIDTSQLRASLLLEPSDGFQNNTVVSYQVARSRSSASVSLDRTSATTAVLAPTCGKYCAYIDLSLRTPEATYLFVANTTTVDLTDNFKLKNIFGYIRSVGDTNAGQDSTGSSNIFLPAGPGLLGFPHQINIDLPVEPRKAKDKQVTDEVQLQGNAFDHKLNYTVGGMYDNTIQPHNVNDINIYSVSYSGVLTGFANAVNFQATEVLSKAAYASATYSPVDKLNITGGFRETWVDLTQYGAEGSYAVGATPQLAPTVPISVFKGHYRGSTYNAGVDYHIDDRTMIYGGFRHGYKRGGINPSSNGDSFDPETVNDYSAGMKTSFRIADIPVRFNIEGFYDSYKGLQTSDLVLGAAQLETLTINVPKTRYEGFDADVWTQPVAWLDLAGSWSYNDAKFVNWTDPSNPSSDLTVNKVPDVSKDRVSGSARFHGELPGDLGELVWLTSYNYQTKFYTTPFNNRLGAITQAVFGFTVPGPSVCAGGICGNTINGYSTVDMRLELNHAFGSHFDLAAGVTNLTNKFFLIGSSGTLDLGAEGFAVGAPRMFVFEVKTKF